MVLTMTQLQDRWPAANLESLPPDVQAIYQTWMGLRVLVLQAAHNSPSSPVPVPPYSRRPRKEIRARDLTLCRAPFPAGTPGAPAVLSRERVEELGELWGSGSSSSGGGGADAAPPPRSDKDEIADLRNIVKDQQIAIQKLLRQQEALIDDKDATSAYTVTEASLARLPDSWRKSVPMSRVDRRRLRRDHGGIIPSDRMPKDLVLTDDVKAEKSVASAKITLVALAKDVVGPLMEGNTETLRMVVTAHSRLTDLMADVQGALDSAENSVFPAREIRDDLEPLMGAVSASLDLAIDVHARLRTAITSRVERAMGFSDLHEDPNKRSKETFLSDDFQKLVEEKAKEKAHLAWARSGSGAPRASLHDGPPPKAHTRGGKNHRGRGRGNSTQPPPAAQAKSKGGGGGGKGSAGRGQGK